MKKLIAIIVVLLITSLSFGKSITNIDDTLDFSLENTLVVLGNFNENDVEVKMSIYYAPLEDQIEEDEWKPLYIQYNSNSYLVTFELGFIYLIVFTYLEQAYQYLYVNTTDKGIVEVDINLTEGKDALLFYDNALSKYIIHTIKDI